MRPAVYQCAVLSAYIDLALGLVLAFLLLSLLVSGLNEAIVRILAIRSKFLWAYLRDTLDGDAPKGRSWLPTRVREVFASLPFARDPRPEHDARPAPMPGEPAEDSPGMTLQLYERVREIDHPVRGRTGISDLPPERFSVAMMELAASSPGGVEGLLEKLKASGSPLYGHLKGVWESAQRDLERFREGMEQWFDSEMQRLSELYKRYVKWVVAVLGLAVTLLATVDGLEYSGALLRDNAYRATVAAVAQGGPGAYEQLRTQCEQGDPVGCVTDTLSQPALARILENAIIKIDVGPGGQPSFEWNGAAWWDRLITPSHWPGYLLTFVALLFGAPFWWDVLRRLTGIRARR